MKKPLRVPVLIDRDAYEEYRKCSEATGVPVARIIRTALAAFNPSARPTALVGQPQPQENVWDKLKVEPPTKTLPFEIESQHSLAACDLPASGRSGHRTAKLDCDLPVGKTPQRKSERNEEIRIANCLGVSRYMIAYRHGISLQRVDQIIDAPLRRHQRELVRLLNLALM